ncbi:autotransporter-associated beta strand repeat protein [Pedosphaera parvula Ellin514]|uniref:Autotransporter-associated beta strand repeat protein n=2 Tax=Pedosphaera TaxID=1032526 RepID=B9XCS1_PEDPL|nr:autotransporter-associated beta strand repeat protein [Pedosphaera parvula Ellin514]
MTPDLRQIIFIQKTNFEDFLTRKTSNNPNQNSPMKKLLLLCSCLCLLIFASNARAVVTYWDPIGTTGANPYLGDLSGSWEAASWSTSGTGQATPVAWVDNSAACFAVHSGTGTPLFTVTANANHNIAGFFDGPLTPNPCPVLVTGTGVFTLVAGLDAFDVTSNAGDPGSVTINNAMTGPGTVTPEGSGQIFLHGTNSYTGGVSFGYAGASFIGILNFSNSVALGTGNIGISNSPGGALVLEGSSAMTITNTVSGGIVSSLNIVANPAGLTFTAPWTLGGVPLSIGAGGSGNLVTISGPIDGYGGMKKFNASTLMLSGANTISGNTFLSNGVVRLGNPAALGSSLVTVINDVTSGTLDLNGIAGINTALVLNGTGFGGAGALINSNTSTTATLIGNGTVAAATVTAAANDITSPATITFSGGGGSGAVATPSLGVTASSFTINAGTQKYTAVPTVVISGGGGKFAYGTCVLAGTSPSVISTTITIVTPGYGYTSAPTITFTGGTLSGTGTAPTGTGNATHFALVGARITQRGSNYTSAPTLTLSSGSATAVAQLASVNLTSSSSVGGPGNITINDSITDSGTFSGLTKVGAGTVTLTAANTYTGPTEVNGGTLALTGSGSLLSSSITVDPGATFDVSGLGSLSQIGVTTINGDISGTVALGTASQPVALTFTPTAFTGDMANPALFVSASVLSLSNNVFFVNNAAGSPLGAGIYNLIQVGDGTTGTIIGSPNGVAFVGGAGLASGDVASVSVVGSTVVLTVTAATHATTTALSATSPLTYGQSTTFTATVAPVPTGGDVQFYVNGMPLGVPVPVSSINGTATSIGTSTSLAAGSPSITAQYSGSTNSAYSPSSASAVTQVVNPASLTVTANNQTVNYGTAIALTGSTQFTSSGLVNGETIGSVSMAVSGGGANSESIGTYSITPSAATGGSFNAANYNITYVGASTGLTVNPKPLTITASAQSKAYGTTLTLGTTQFTSSGLVLGQTIGGVTLSASGGTAATDPAGTYTLTPSVATGGTFIPANYTITYATGVLTVTKVAITVTATAETKTYGQVVTFGSGSTLFTVTGLVNGETIGTVTLACTGGTANAAVSGSPYTITPSVATGGTFTAANYTITYATTGKLTVSALPVALSGTRLFDGTATAAAAILSVTNKVGADVVTVGGGSATLASTNAGPEAITSFATLTLGGAAAANYTLTGASGTVLITSPSITISSEFVDSTGTNFVITWASSAGVVYHVIGTNNVAAPQASWPTVAGPITATGASTSVTNAMSTPMEFFQVVSP